jgi:hypothetical protein
MVYAKYEEIGKNESFIDVAISRHNKENGYYLLLQQCVNLVDSVTDNEKNNFMWCFISGIK